MKNGDRIKAVLRPFLLSENSENQLEIIYKQGLEPLMLKNTFYCCWGGTLWIFSHTIAIQIINHLLSCKILDTEHKNTTKGRPKRK